MNRVSLFFFLLMVLSVNPSAAQNKKNSKQTQSVEALIKSYRFSEAAEILQREINAAEKKGEMTDRLRADLHRANLGADMLQGTERVIFIDSFKVARNEMLDVMKISADAGKIIPAHGLKDKIRNAPQYIGAYAYVNSFGDRLFFSASDSTELGKCIYSSFRTGKMWSTPEAIEGDDTGEENKDNPFLMADGITLYYAAQGSSSLGGYDIFVTRYNSESRKFMKPENLGMPFNSPANDYLLAIDETANLGWLVSDRFQHPDTTCVYVFIPTESREIYELTEDTQLQVANHARLFSIKDTQTDPDAVKRAKERLAMADHSNRNEGKNEFRFVINDGIVYTHPEQFRNAQARNLAEKSVRTRNELTELEGQREDLEFLIAQGDCSERTLRTLKETDTDIASLRKLYKEQCKEARKLEINCR